MGNGYGATTVVQTLNDSAEESKQKSFTPPFHISLTRQRKNGIKRSLLNKLNGKPTRQERLAKTAGPFLLLISIYRKMIETAIPVVIAIVTGTAVLFNKVNTRVTTLDNRIDKLELKVVESYTSKQDFTQAMARMGDHLIRIEDKMDQLIAKKF
jgi:hypothetical protein